MCGQVSLYDDKVKNGRVIWLMDGEIFILGSRFIGLKIVAGRIWVWLMRIVFVMGVGNMFIIK